jgi:hypothetical protein
MNDIPAHEKIRTQMSEHATLRAEIIARMGHGYQIVGFGLAAVAIGVSQGFQLGAGLYIGVVVVVVALMWWKSWADTKKCARRIREIELDVNDRAQKDLLVWENLSGEAEIGLLQTTEHLRKALQKKPVPIRTFRGRPIPPKISN